MIIKKKFSKIKRVIDEAPEEDTLSVIDDVVQAYENNNQENETEPAENNGEELTSEQEETNDDIMEEEEASKILSEEEETHLRNIQDLDISLQNIKFEQREERREGTRRRGYRRSQDRNIVSRAQQDAISIRDVAKKEGYNDGLKKAQADIKNIKDKLAEFFNSKEEVYNRVSGCILEIALEIAKKIINKEVNENKEYIISMIKGLLDDINKTENKIILKVSPKDVEILKDKTAEIFSGQGFEAKISVIPDNSIKDGGVILETSNGIIDASINTQIAIMEQVLKKTENEQAQKQQTPPAPAKPQQEQQKNAPTPPAKPQQEQQKNNPEAKK